MPNILVTGGAGFIGSHLCTELVKDSDNYVISLDDYSTGKKENLKHLTGLKNFFEGTCDVSNKKDLEFYFTHSRIDVVFHQAASKKTICLKNPTRDLEVNGVGTLNLLELARDYRANKFIHASTGSVYGEALYHPQDESHPARPCSFYGISKLAGENYVRYFNKQYGLDTTILRYFHVYGFRQDDGPFGGVVAIFRRAIKNKTQITVFGDGTQQRSFTHVKDVVKANIQAWKKDISRGKIYNCASGFSVTLNELLYIMEADMEKIRYKDWQIGDIKEFDVDNSLIKRELNIEYRNLQRGLKEFDSTEV